MLLETDIMLIPSGSTGLSMLQVQTGDGQSELFHELSIVSDKLKKTISISSHLIFWISPSAYHVTLYDGINKENVNELPHDMEKRFGKILDGLPASFQSLFLENILKEIQTLEKLPSPISMRFSHFAIRQDALVAYLSPANIPSADALAVIEAERLRVDEYLHEAFGKRKCGQFEPHVTLCYFHTREALHEGRFLLRNIEYCKSSVPDNVVVTFRTADIYGFTDMVTFFRRDFASTVQD